MDEQVKNVESAEDSKENTYIVIDRYGVVSISNKKYFIKD